MTPWQAHVESWSKCTACHLCEGRTKVVLARGQLPCDVLFVGEAPGPSEDLLGYPFAGPAGHLLLDGPDPIVSEAVVLSGVPRLRMAFTNLVACIPREEGGPKFEEPPDEAVEACEPRLRELVGMAQPSAIVCVGKLAATWLVPGKRGRGILGHLPEDLPTVQVDHPAAILRANEATKGLMRRKVVVKLANLFHSLAEKACRS